MPDTLPELTASLEDYLETIYHLVQQGQVARSSEISRELKVHKSSVTGALKALAKQNLINYEPYGHITLTDMGRLKAEDVVRRHETLMGFFSRVLGIDGQEAETAACRMEHATSRRVVNRLILLGEYLERSGKEGEAWKKDFHAFCTKVESQQKEQRTEKASAKKKAKQKRKGAVKGKALSVKDLEAGDHAVLTTLNRSVPGQQRLLDAGATDGALIEVEKVSARSIQIQVRGYHLTLLPGEAGEIGVSVS